MHSHSPVIMAALAALLLAGPVRCAAQQAEDAEDFIPREKVIFYEDFEKDAPNTFPAHWYILPADRARPITTSHLCVVDKTGESAMVLTPGTTPDENRVEPRMSEKDYLPDSFTLQYDILPGTATSSPVLYLKTTAQAPVPLAIYKEGNNWKISMGSRTADITSEIAENKWQHFALSYQNRKLACYLDETRVLAAQDCGFDPAGFQLSADRQGPVSYANIRLATGAYLMGEHYNFSRLFSADKFTTHSIHFEVKMSAIQPGSMEFIRKLAGWLKQNPTVRMEIDGHTDNDGDAAANMKLSQERADAVKNQLVAYGINALRLTAKGFGATVPIQPNTTPEGKADNRRVEFVKR